MLVLNELTMCAKKHRIKHKYANTLVLNEMTMCTKKVQNKAYVQKTRQNVMFYINNGCMPKNNNIVQLKSLRSNY